MSDKRRGTIAELREENARLRAALKPVLECRVRDCMFAECNDGRMKYLFDLIRSAQRIYTGGGESEVE